MARNIVLVGFMGTGKSRVGRALAARLGLEFLDADAEIEKREGRAISRIFAESGEAYFRGLERQLARELSGRSGLVVATGGGIVLNPDNIADLSRTGLVVCLLATPEEILRRVGHETHRPLLAVEDKLGRIRELLERRRSLYEAIPLRIETSGLAVDEVVARILAEYGAP
jgi:shikimate kinase